MQALSHADIQIACFYMTCKGIGAPALECATAIAAYI